MSKFKVGDRVVVYGAGFLMVPIPRYAECNNNGWPATVHSLETASSIIVRSELDGAIYAAHPKQCRKLIKKPRRRIWVSPESFQRIIEYTGTPPNGVCIPATVEIPGWIEFVEVKKK